MRTLPLLHPQLQLANMPLPAINISTANRSQDGRRIAPLQLHLSPTATVATHAADLMLGLKRLAQRDHDEQHDDATSGPLYKRARGQSQPTMNEATTKSDSNTMRLPTPPGVFMSSPLAALVNAHRPMVLPSIRSPVEASQASTASVEATRDADARPQRTASVPLVSFLGKRSHDDHVSSAHASVFTQAASPTSVWEDDACLSSDGGDQLSPIKSPAAPMYTHAVRPQISTLRVPTLHHWQAPRLASSNSPPLVPARPPSSLPTLAETALPRQAAPIPSTAPMATTRPTLVRKSSSQWRQDMPIPDREKTRERIQRGLHNTCRGDYEAMLRIVCAMEEELLHLHTTSKDHYFLQTLALRDRIHALRTGSPHQQPSQ